MFYYIMYAVAHYRVNLFSVENFWQLLHTFGCVERIPFDPIYWYCSHEYMIYKSFYWSQ